MNTDPRSTQFAGFAKLLVGDLPEPPTDDSVTGIAYANWKEEVRQLIAQRAYDLVQHTLKTVPALINAMPDAQVVGDVIGMVPDMTKWPEEGE